MKTNESVTARLGARLAILALAAVSLAGCYVYPAEPAPVYYGPAYVVRGPGYGYGPGYWNHGYWDGHRGPGHHHHH